MATGRRERISAEARAAHAATITADMASKPSTNLSYWRGGICLILGIFIVLGPHIMRSPFWIDMLASSQAVGWFALVLSALFFWRGWRSR